MLALIRLTNGPHHRFTKVGFHIWRPQWVGGGGPKKADKRIKISWFVTMAGGGKKIRTSYIEAPLGETFWRHISILFPPFIHFFRPRPSSFFFCRNLKCGVVGVIRHFRGDDDSSFLNLIWYAADRQRADWLWCRVWQNGPLLVSVLSSE